MNPPIKDTFKNILGKFFHSKFSLLVAFTLLGGMFLSINVALENQNSRSRAAETTSLYPPATTFTLKAVPSVAQPGYLSSFTDPTFGSKVTRVSDLTAMGVDLTSKKYVRNAYAKKPAWNTDGSRILLGYVFPAPLLDGNTYQFIKQVNAPFHASWSYTQPNIIYGVDYYKGDLLSFDINNETTTIVKHFDGYKNFTMGGGEGNQSDDDRWFVFIAQDASNNFVVILYDKTNDTSVIKNFGTTEPNWAGMSHSGNNVIISWNTIGTTQTSGTTVYNNNLTFVRNVTKSISHGDLAYDTTGREVYVTAGDCMVDTLIAPCSKASYMSAYPLNGSTSFSVISKTVGYNPNGEHTSGRNFKRPGWVYMSDYGAPGASPYVGRDEIFAVKLDPNISGDAPVVNRFAHTHHDTDMPYATMPFGVPSPDGTKVLWGSEWHQGANAAAFAYVAEAPAGGFSIAEPVTALSNITWTNGVNVTTNGSKITKTAGTNGAWDAGARSSQTINSGNGSAEITITQEDVTRFGRMFGLNHDNTTASYTDIDYAFFFAGSGILQIYENGGRPSTYQGTYTTGDTFKVAVENGKVTYYKNGTAVFTSSQTPVYPLFVDTSLNALNSQIATGNLATSTQSPTSVITSSAPTSTPIPSPTSTNSTNQVGNISQGKPTTASSQQSANPASSGNDGNTNTRWTAANGNAGHWWKVDLGTVTNITNSEVIWEFGGSVYKYKIETSTDNSNWSTKVDKTNNTSTSQTQTDTFSASARYVRITITGLSGGWAGFREFKVFNSAGQTPTNTPTNVPNPTPSAGSPTATPTPTKAPTSAPTSMPNTTNLALKKSTTAGSTYSSAYAASKAIDGSTGTYWISKSTNRWITVDLGNLKNVSKFIIKHYSGTYITKDFSIQTSTNNSTWTTVVNVVNNTASTTTHSISARSARYIRVNIVKPAQNSYPYAIIRELEVY